MTSQWSVKRDPRCRQRRSSRPPFSWRNRSVCRCTRRCRRSPRLPRRQYPSFCVAAWPRPTGRGLWNTAPSRRLSSRKSRWITMRLIRLRMARVTMTRCPCPAPARKCAPASWWWWPIRDGDWARRKRGWTPHGIASEQPRKVIW